VILFEQFNFGGYGLNWTAFWDATPTPLALRSVFPGFGGPTYHTGSQGAGPLFLEDFSPSSHKLDRITFIKQSV